MTAEELTYYLSVPDSDYEAMAATLRDAAARYPYCSLLPIVMAAAGKKAGDKNRESLIRRAAAYAPDRAALFHYLTALEEDLRKEQKAEDGKPEDESEQPPQAPRIRTGAKTEKVKSEQQQAETQRPKAGSKNLGGSTASRKEERAVIKKSRPGPIALNIDDNVPRTFTFWLRRIREVSDTIKLDTDQRITQAANDDLEKQYYGQLASHKTFSEFEGTTNVEYDLGKKEDRIIAKFIQEDPQVIRPAVNLPSGDRSLPQPAAGDESDLSAGTDGGEFYSETLAKIYIEQGMKGKAIGVYKKLSLKFPEKSSYFAGLIKDLQES